MSRRKNTNVSLDALSHVDSRDMLVLQDTASKVLSDLSKYHSTEPTTEGAAHEVTSRDMLESVYGYAPDDEDERKPFVYNDGVAVIPIHGTLINRFNGSWGFVTGYQYIRRMLNLALDDDDVQIIVFDVDSPGGDAAGCFELAREILASRRVKPSVAVVDSVAASGGFALPCCATAVYAIESARVGSIGVYRMHVSYEDALKQAGLKVTFATAGEHKVDGNPYEDLPSSVLNEWRENAGKTWDTFISLVAEARGLSEDEVRATQARVYRAEDALAKGLIDAVKTPTEAVAAFLAELADSEPSFDDEEDTTMADPKAKEVTSSLTEADLTKIAQIAAQAAGSVVKDAMSGMQRTQAIRDHATAIGPQASALAKNLIDNDALSAEDAIGMLDAAFGATSVSSTSKKTKKTKAKAKAKVQAVQGDEDEDDLDEDEDEDDLDEDEDEDDLDEDEEESARVQRKRGKDRVNHFADAMGRSRNPNAGGGRAKGGNEGQRASANPLLADHAKVTGAHWSRDAVKTQH